MPKPPRWAPEPPFTPPPARTVRVPGRGEFFLRDTGGDEPVVMLLHGWMASGDLNWAAQYEALSRAGYRVLAIDHRGHGRGLRPLVPFRLADCAADAAGVLRELGLAPALVVGYSMGGAIAQLVAREHPDVVRGLVLSGTAQHWQEPEVKRRFRLLGLLGLSLSVAPRATWRATFRQAHMGEDARAVWLQSELMRHSSRDIAEAGRELGRFDSRPWAGEVGVRTAVVLTTRDELVPPRKQWQLAEAWNAEVYEVALSHMELGLKPGIYNPALLSALEAVASPREDAVAVA